MLGNSVAVVRTRPRAIPLAMITMRKSTHGFPFLPYTSMGLRLAARAPLLDKEGKVWLNMNFLLPSSKKNYPRKQAAKGKKYVFIIYLNPGKHKIIIKQQTKFFELSWGEPRRYAVTVALFVPTMGELTFSEIRLLSLVKIVYFWPLTRSSSSGNFYI